MDVKKPRMYVAGPMTGIPYFNFPKFDAARDHYIQLGYEVFNPADHDRSLLGKPKNWMPTDEHHDGQWKRWTIDNAPSLREMLGADLNWIAHQADAIVMLPGWENSRGANAEWALAKALDLNIRYYPN